MTSFKITTDNMLTELDVWVQIISKGSVRVISILKSGPKYQEYMIFST